jgi:hypothetical protein
MLVVILCCDIAAIYFGTLVLSILYWGFDEMRKGNLFASDAPARRGPASYGAVGNK